MLLCLVALGTTVIGGCQLWSSFTVTFNNTGNHKSQSIDVEQYFGASDFAIGVATIPPYATDYQVKVTDTAKEGKVVIELYALTPGMEPELLERITVTGDLTIDIP